MPILDIEIVGARPTLADLPTRLADTAGSVLGASVGATWVKLRLVPAEDYGESGCVAAGVEPVFVTVRRRQVPAREELESECRELTFALAAVLGRPAAHVHVYYEPDSRGRQAFGGRLVE